MKIEFKCVCGGLLTVDEAHASRRTQCPKCRRIVTIPEPAGAVESPEAAVEHQAVCPLCRWPFNREEGRTRCPSCDTEYHAACWQENGGCGVHGCPQVPPTEHRGTLEIPASYWGQENKPCPACGAMILASAIRCRNCGAILGSVRPEDSNAYEQRKAAEGRLPALRRGVVWLFIFCIIPFTAPIAAIGGVYWYLSNRQDLKRLPSLHQAVLKISLCVALGQTLFTVLAVVAFGWGRG